MKHLFGLLAAAVLPCAAARAQEIADAAPSPAISSGDTAWMITATALVLFMTLPGLALIVDKTIGARVSADVERGGVDIAEHEEQGYDIA